MSPPIAIRGGLFTFAAIERLFSVPDQRSTAHDTMSTLETFNHKSEFSVTADLGEEYPGLWISNHTGKDQTAIWCSNKHDTTVIRKRNWYLASLWYIFTAPEWLVDKVIGIQNAPASQPAIEKLQQ
ncbi:hypothetical protein N7463_010165 [Penicillium fimorum]|uniref:Uncharacterized protein n=1 Tax=Penicillium fimorum TaxID=1882269 RepID=A0A9X0C105_9EURO|nr:hypothetical protein N7463_010165 [Penicillium fimorum]